ncbi:MAG: UDP-glucose/GDP-mannose dehydrogenase family protein [Methanomassiliicoccales archaeon]
MNRLKISIIGTGYVGLVTGLCFSQLGHEVICIDNVPEKIENLRNGRSPIHEPGIEDMLRKHLKDGSFKVGTRVDRIIATNITFICVGTPSKEDGSMDMAILERAAEKVGKALEAKDDYHNVVVKSTVVPNTTEKVVLPALERTSKKKVGRDFGLAVNPEFLKEGSAVEDFMHPDRVVIGGFDRKSTKTVRSLYEVFDCPIVEVTLSTAEMIKMASNAFLAARISFMNEIGNICKSLGIDVREVAKGMGYDRRIGPQFLRAGCGFGGSCFPKDVSGLAAEARRRGIDPLMLETILEINEAQPLRMIELLENHMNIEGKKIAVLGLAFKPDTDDIRDARSIVVVNELLRKGAKVRCHDPKAMDNFKREFPEIEYCPSPKECVKGSDAIMLVTEWPEYAHPELYGSKLVIDGRGVVRTKNYDGICW